MIPTALDRFGPPSNGIEQARNDGWDQCRDYHDAHQDAVMSMTEAAAHLGIDRTNLKRLTERGVIPCWFQTDSGRYVYTRRTLLESMRQAAIKEAS